MVVLWTQSEEESKHPLPGSRPPSSTSFISVNKTTSTSPGSIAGLAHHPRTDGRPPKPPVAANSKYVIYRNGEELTAQELPSERLLVAVKTVKDSAKIVQLGRSNSNGFSPHDFSTPKHTKGSAFSDDSSDSFHFDSSSSFNSDFRYSMGHRLARKMSSRNGTLNSSSGYHSHSFNATADTTNGAKCVNGKFSSMFGEEVDVQRTPVTTESRACVLNSADMAKSMRAARKPSDKHDEETAARNQETQPQKRDRKRFYSLPRNWRGKATDFIWSRGKEIILMLGEFDIVKV